jgi:hypothetical protein
MGESERAESCQELARKGDLCSERKRWEVKGGGVGANANARLHSKPNLPPKLSPNLSHYEQVAENPVCGCQRV